MAKHTRNNQVKKDAVFVYSEEQLGYKFSDTHPFNQKRLTLTTDLLKKMNALSDGDIVLPRIATDEELLLAHEARYIDIVKKASIGLVTAEQTESYGIGTDDTPIFANMHEASARRKSVV